MQTDIASYVAEVFVVNTNLLSEISNYFALFEKAQLKSLTPEEVVARTRLIYHSIRSIYSLISSQLPYLETAIPELAEVISKGYDHRTIHTHNFVSLVRNNIHLLPEDLRLEVEFLIDSVYDAVKELVEAHLRFLRSYLMKIKLKLTQQDGESVVGTAIWATYLATFNYNPYHQIAYTTFVSWWVNSLLRRLGRDDADDGVLFSFIKKFNVKCYRALLEASKQGKLTSQVVCQICGVNPAYIFTSFSTDITVQSIDELAYPEGNRRYLLADILPDPDELPPEERLDKEQLYVVLSELDADQQEIIKLRFGFEGKAHNISQIARKLGLSRSVVRNRLQQALEILRERLESHYSFQG